MCPLSLGFVGHCLAQFSVLRLSVVHLRMAAEQDQGIVVQRVELHFPAIGLERGYFLSLKHVLLLAVF